ncbi:MAG: alpha/beta hydrolase [Acidimicrobiales bacterium]|nr:MAG: alpha/beta hydrolase [Acidimicrobiales bacterium]
MVPGPWSHRFISANGNRFHLAECGSGKLVLFLHGFPDYWWTWREQLPVFAAAGYHAVAMDLRGYGASDKPPRGYDAYTLAADVAGVIRALGQRNALVVGHDWGGLLGWSAAAFHPRLVSKLAVIAAAHPLLIRRAMLADHKQRSALAHMFAFQLPRFEYVLTRNNGAYLNALVHRWAGPQWRTTSACAEHAAACVVGMRTNHVAFCALEYYRWAIRSLTRRSGWQYAALMNRCIPQSVLQLHGSADSCILPSTVAGAQRYVRNEYNYQELTGVGHFPHLEDSSRTNQALLSWAATP